MKPLPDILTCLKRIQADHLKAGLHPTEHVMQCLDGAITLVQRAIDLEQMSREMVGRETQQILIK